MLTTVKLVFRATTYVCATAQPINPRSWQLPLYTSVDKRACISGLEELDCSIESD